jgi:hypothetical protein
VSRLLAGTVAIAFTIQIANAIVKPGNVAARIPAASQRITPDPEHGQDPRWRVRDPLADRR